MTYKINLFPNPLKTLDFLSHKKVDFLAQRPYTIRTIRATEEQTP